MLDYKHKLEPKRKDPLTWLLSLITDPVHSGAYGEDRMHHPVVGSHDVLGGTTHGNWSDFNNWEDILEIFVGFTNSTQITFGENRTTCQFALEGIYASAVDATEVLTRRDPIDYFDFWLAFDMYL